jgi:hypothetical protein
MRTAIIAQFPADESFVKNFDGYRVSLTCDPREALTFDSISAAMDVIPVILNRYSGTSRVSFLVIEIEKP